MDNTANYVDIMIDGLKKKIIILDKIIELDEQQTSILTDADSDPQSFYDNVDKKEQFVDELNGLDDGFDALYNRIRIQFLDGKDKYAEQIKIMKILITQITERSVKIQKEEAQNKLLADKKFAVMKKDIRNAKRSGTMASNYYKSMSRVDDTPQFLDQKK